MSAGQRTFRVAELPDPEYSAYQARADGDVRSAVARDCERLLRAVAGFPAETVTAEIRFVYAPSANRAECQRRLGIYLNIWASDEATAERVSAFVARGPLSGFYKFEPVADAPALAVEMRAGSDICRRADLEQALHPPEFNCNIPTHYFRIESFEPNEDNEPLLDQVLGNLSEPVDISVRVEPSNVRRERSEHTRYLARLHLVNRNTDRNNGPGELDYLGSGDGPNYGARASLEPLQLRDPIADDVLRAQQRFHDTFSMPHLLFHIRVLAASSPTAMLVGRAIAESAFTEGSYELVAYREGEELFAQAVRGWTATRVVTLPVWQRLWGDERGELYRSLVRLVSLAPVDELVGAFRLPIAAHGSPCCIRKNTDPPTETDLIVFGNDLEPLSGAHSVDGGLPRGIPLDRLVKHLFITGLPGMGKTTAVMNLLIQLANVQRPPIAAVTGK